jgi:signal transduction histidine kinase
MISLRQNGATADHLGLGLYIAKLIATGHGGSITADNTENGVVFSVQLPIDPESRGHTGPA